MNTHELRAANTDTTEPHTLWTLTMMDVLYDGLVSDKPDKAINESVRELYLKNVKPSWLVRKVARDLGGDYSLRLLKLMQK